MSAPSNNPTSPGAPRRVADGPQLHQIVEKLFCRFPIHAIEANQKHAVQVLQYRQPAFEVQHKLPGATSRRLLLEKDSNTMLLECQVVERTAQGSEILKPLNLTLSQRGIRHEARVAVSGSSSEAGVILNAIPHAEFFRFNAATHPNRDPLMTQYTAALKNLFPGAETKIEFQRSLRLSVRIKKLQELRLPIFAPRIGFDRQGKDLELVAMPTGEHQQIVRADGLTTESGSEICEPLYYRGVFIFGFMQVYRAETALTLSQYHTLRQLARRFEADLDAKRCYPSNGERGKLVDISHGGAGFIYPMQRNLLSPVGRGESIVFDAQLTTDDRTTFSARVASTTAQETGKRYGVEFEWLSEENERVLKKVLPATKS